MSRIHEALQRARGTAVGVGGLHGGQAPAPPAGGSVIELYRAETPGTVAREGPPSVDYPQEAGGLAAQGLPPTTLPPEDQAVAAHGLPPSTDPGRTTEASREGGQPARTNAAAPMIAPSGPHPVGAEQYRRLAAALHELQVTRGLTTVMVTSALPQDGKTLTAVNLALALSGSYDRRVLVVDADMRRASLHTLLQVPRGPGLSDVLEEGQRELPIVEVSPRLSVLPAGRGSSDPLAGLSSDRMPRLLEACASRFDWVVLDTPPVGPTPDAQLLAHLIQAVIFVIRAGATPFPAVERAIADIGRECIVGTVLNHVDENRIGSSYDYGHYQSIP